MNIPITKVQIDTVDKEEVMNVLDSGILAQGDWVARFEQEFAQFCGVKHAIAVNNGTSALHTALFAAGIKPGDEVITTPFTFVATANAIMMCGGKPVFVDIDPKTFNIDTSKIEKAITKKTKAILPVDLYGHIADVPELEKIAKKHKLKLVFDAAQSVAAEYSSKRSGAFGDVTSFSLYATKNLMCGEGGILTTNNDEIAEVARRFRNHGQGDQYEYIHMGYNYRMTNISAAIALAQLLKLEKNTQLRRRNASFYSEQLEGIEGFRVPIQKEHYKHIFHQYTLRIENSHYGKKRDELLKKLNSTGVGARVYYPKPLHLHKHFKQLGYKQGDFPEAERASQEVISLPVHPLLTKDELNYIVKEFLE
jgi:perosamine synthetase